MPSTKTLLLIAFFACTAELSHAQEYCFHVEKRSEPSELMTYLLAHYGPEAGEEILLNLRVYEKTHDKKVLAQEQYASVLEKIDVEIGQNTDPAYIAELEARKTKFVLITAIEDQLH